MNEVLNQIAPIELSELEELVGGANEKGIILEKIDTVSDIPIDLVVRLGKKKMILRDIRQLSVGDVLEVEKKAGHKVDIYLADQHAGIGEVLLVDDKFGIVVSEIFNYPRRKVNKQ